MKGIYFSNCNLSNTGSGPSKKINMQMQAIKSLGIDVISPKVYVDPLWQRIYVKLPFTSSWYDHRVKEYIRSKTNGMDFVYFRHDVFTRQLIKNLKLLKEKNITVLYEIPTYPYDRNSNKPINWFMRQKDKYWRNHVRGLIDYIVDYSDSEEIFGCKTINVFNGIDVNFVTRRSYKAHGDTINLIGVALLARAHGFDRIIHALNGYDENKCGKKIVFHIVGEGDAKKELVALTEELELGDKVVFHGFKSGSELDEIYDIADVGVGTLALHRRIRDSKVSSLKTKEYCAKGLPFISCENDDAFSTENFPFVYIVGQNEDEIDLYALVEWYKKLLEEYGGNEKMAETIRNYASRNLAWVQQMEKVFTYIRR